MLVLEYVTYRVSKKLYILLLLLYVFNKYGFWKYLERCRKRHVSKIWENTSCVINLCIYRHSRECSYFGTKAILNLVIGAASSILKEKSSLKNKSWKCWSCKEGYKKRFSRKIKRTKCSKEHSFYWKPCTPWEKVT